MEMNEEEMSFEELFENSIKDVTLGRTVTGKIVKITEKGEIFVDLGYKADGIIPRSEYSFDENANPKDEFKVGDSITADVVKMNDGVGNVLLSYKKAKGRNARKEFEKKVKEEAIFEETIKEATDKGFIVHTNGVRVFIPLSLSGITREESIESYKGKKIRFKITEYNDRKIIGSVKALVQEERKEEIEEFWKTVEAGKEYEGKIASIVPYGLFVQIGPERGLLHVSEISWSKNIDINNLFTLGQDIKVIVKEIDFENKKLVLQYAQKGENPWGKLAEKYQINDIVPVKVVKFMPFGAFVELEEGIEGLVHISQISERRIAKPEEALQIGQIVNAKIIEIDPERQKIELSIRELEGTSQEYNTEEQE